MFLDPDLAKKVKLITIMGGGFGIWHRLHELNFGYDPEAARVVMTSGAPIILVPLDTTLQTALLLEDNAQLTNSNRPLARHLGLTCDPYIRYVAQARGRVGVALHDPLAIAVLIERSFVTVETACVDVELNGRYTRGRPVSWLPDSRQPSPALKLPTMSTVEIVTAVDNLAFKHFMLQRLLA